MSEMFLPSQLDRIYDVGLREGAPFNVGYVLSEKDVSGLVVCGLTTLIQENIGEPSIIYPADDQAALLARLVAEEFDIPEMTPGASASNYRGKRAVVVNNLYKHGNELGTAARQLDAAGAVVVGAAVVCDSSNYSVPTFKYGNAVSKVHSLFQHYHPLA